MSLEEDTELRDLISQTLETNGCFAKIRAQLRASIYLALDEDDVFQKKELFPNKKLTSTLQTVEGKIMFCIVREFLEHFDLNFTTSVFEPESFIGSKYEYMGKNKLIEDLKLPHLEQESSDPVLLQLIHLCKISKPNDSRNSVSNLSCKSESSRDCCEENSMSSSLNDTLIKSVSNDLIPENILNQTFDVKVQSIQTANIAVNTKRDSQNNQSSNNLILSKDLDTNNFFIDKVDNEKSLINFDKSVKIENKNIESDTEKSKFLMDQTIIDPEYSPPILKDSKYLKFDSSFDKAKLSCSKSDKIKVKNNLSSLSDLPPLQISKSRSNDMLLPSLYTKEFKEKGNIKDIEKLFELEPLDNYEEDFISETEIDLSINKQDETVNNVLEKVANKNENISNHIPNKGELERNKKTYQDHSTSSSVTSEDFELNSNIDDILNSC